MSIVQLCNWKRLKRSIKEMKLFFVVVQAPRKRWKLPNDIAQCFYRDIMEKY